MNTINILIVDDHKIFRNGLKTLLLSFPYVKIIGEASNGKEFTEILYNSNKKIDIVFMDINMPLINGVEATRSALKIDNKLKIIALTAFIDEDYLEQMLLAGVEGYMLKSSEIEDFENAILKINSGGNYFSSEIINLLSDKLNTIRKKIKTKEIPNFTDREKMVLNLICEGLSNKQIAESMYISEKTVEKHKSNLFQKTETNNTVNLVIYAFKNQLIET